MKPHINPSPALFALIVILAMAICFPVVWCKETQPYDVCGQSVKCGNITLDYPFWGLGRPPYCGHSGFYLTCQSDVLVLLYESVNYRVLGMNSSIQMITVARNDLWSNFCPQILYNTTYNMTLLNGQYFIPNISLYYGCNFSALGLLGANYQFSCNVNNSQSHGYFISTNDTSVGMYDRLVQCNNHIIVPVNRYSANQLETGTATTSDLRSALLAGFNLQWTANNDECDRCIQSEGRCGSNITSPNLFACYCSNGNFSLMCNNAYERGGSKGATKMVIIIGISCGIAGTMLLLFVILCQKKRLWETQWVPGLKRMSRFWGTSRNLQIEIFIEKYGNLAPRRFKYSDIRKMTKSFQEKLGQGGYGIVYKGQMPDGQLVAVKLLAGVRGYGEDFINEVASISRTSHVNIVTLIGFCIDGKKRALIYDFMPNGSLDKFLRNDSSHLDWTTLFQIAKGIARGLEYLHQGCNTRIVHFDIKPHNILLDKEFVPKISDFGLAKLCKTKESIMSEMGARGTAGYMAPEVFFRRLGGASHKSDVYSYGMMVLEMTGARKHNNASTSEAYFPDWIFKQVEAGGNLRIYGVETDEEEELARKMMTVSLWCIQYDPSDRPSISKVLEMLEGSFESLQVPPKRLWSSLTKAAQNTCSLGTHSLSSERLDIVQDVEEFIAS